VEFAAAYLRVEQARFGERLRVEFQVIQHRYHPGAGHEHPTAHRERRQARRLGGGRPRDGGVARAAAGGWLSIEVFDNGPGFPAGFSLSEPASPNTGGYGLRNVAERLRGYYGDLAQLYWENGADGTHVFMRIPHPPPDLTGRNQSDPGTDRRR